MPPTMNDMDMRMMLVEMRLRKTGKVGEKKAKPKKAPEGAKLESQRHAAALSERNAAYERSVVEKEREALLEHQKTLAMQKEEAERDRKSLNEKTSQLSNARDAVSAMAEEAQAARNKVAELATQTQHEAELIALSFAAPASQRNLITSMCPSCDAMCRGIVPSCSAWS